MSERGRACRALGWACVGVGVVCVAWCVRGWPCVDVGVRGVCVGGHAWTWSGVGWAWAWMWVQIVPYSLMF